MIADGPARCSLCRSTDLQILRVSILALPLTIVALKYRGGDCAVRQWHLEPVRTIAVICLELLAFFSCRG